MGKQYTVLVLDSITGMDWVPAYEAAVPAILARHGGRYLARGAADTIERIEGDGEMPAGLVLVEWPSKEAAEGFFGDPEYKPHRDARLVAATGVSYLVQGLEDT